MLRDKLQQELYLLCAIIANPKKLRDKLQIGHVIYCYLSATCLATPLQDKLEEKLGRVTLV